jgi:hypothetical protein
MDITDRGTDTITTGVTIRIPTIVATITDIAIDITTGELQLGARLESRLKHLHRFVPFFQQEVRNLLRKWTFALPS